jgi:flavin reductase (DIM6/NTAB) family NADH-FMN oxidoreductase RutF
MSGVPVTVCEDCGGRYFPRRFICPACGGTRLDAVELEEGIVEDATLVRRAPAERFAEPVPVGTVRLVDGPQVVARLAAGVAPGSRVRVVVDRGGPVAFPVDGGPASHVAGEADAAAAAQRAEQAEWRRLLGHWATGVSVVTSQGEDGPRGCTANSLTSLSLDPLLLLVCFELSANTLAAVRHSGRFCVNVLSADGEAVAREFATKRQDEKFARAPYTLIEGAPVLDGCSAWLVCAVEDELPGGDHAIVIGRPVRGASTEQEPLIFFRGGYWELAPRRDVAR